MLMSKVGSSYFSLLFCIYIVGVILTALTMGGAYYVTAAMCLGLIIALDIQNTRMAACIAMACMLGSVTAKCFTYCVTYYAIIAGMAPQIFTDGVNISMVQSIVANWPMFFVCLFSLWVFSKWYKADRPLESKEYFAEQLAALGPWRREEKMNLIILSGILLYMATTTLTGFDISYSLMIGAFLFFFPGINSSPKETLRHISFDMIFFIGACMSIGTVAAYLGFGQLISDYCLPLFAKTNNNTFAIFGVLFAIIFVLNFLMTPMAIDLGFSNYAVSQYRHIFRYGSYSFHLCIDALRRGDNFTLRIRPLSLRLRLRDAQYERFRQNERRPLRAVFRRIYVSPFALLDADRLTVK